MKKTWLIAVAFLSVVCLCWHFAASAEAAKDELVIAIGAQPEALDPIAMASAPAATVGQHIHQSLIYMSPDGTPKPSLAESWESAPDGLSWTLKLRKGVKFHDGTAFNAQAVKVNLDRFLDPDNKAPFRFLISELKGVEVVDDHTVRLTLNRPFAPYSAKSRTRGWRVRCARTTAVSSRATRCGTRAVTSPPTRGGLPLT